MSEIIFSGEARWKGRRHSDSSGFVVMFELASPEDYEQFARLVGLGNEKPVVSLAVVLGTQESYTPKDYGREAQSLRRAGFARAPAVWAALGTDTEYLGWIRGQPCACAQKVRAKELPPCQGDIVAAHVRRIEHGAGVGIKPAYSAIALCHGHHSLQHQHGESKIAGDEWWDIQRIRHVETWAWERLRAVIGVESMADADPAAVRKWAEDRDLGPYLPGDY